MTLRKTISKSEFTKSIESAKSNPFNTVRKPSTSKYVMRGGIPHKWVDGSLVSLTKLSK
jgi:hypothetical protein|tara:strand:- start:498 stop:674 length:177 start_codon:yes stop_codon:yes gene_type:complete